MDSTLNRRSVLAGCGGLALASLAGCLGDDDDAGIPDYADYAIEYDDEAFLVYLEEGPFDEFVQEYFEPMDEGEDEENPDEFGFDDPLLEMPFVNVMFFAFLAGFSLGPAGLSDLIDYEERDAFDTDVEEYYMINEAVMLHGDIDTDEIEAELETADDDIFETEFEAVDESGPFTIYEPVNDNSYGDDDGEERRYAVSDSYILTGEDSGVFEAILDRLQDDRETAVEAFDSLEWVLEEAGHGEMALGGYGTEDADEEEEVDLDEDELMGNVEDATAFVSSITLEDESIEIESAGVWEDGLSDEDAEEIDEHLGSLADDRSIDIEDDRMSVSGTYEDETVESVIN